MSDLDVLHETLTEVAKALDEADLEPDLDRTDWAAHANRIGGLRSRFEGDVLGPMHAVEEGLDADERAALRENTAGIAAELAAVAFAAGRADDARHLIRGALRLAPESNELDAASNDMRGFTLLMHARWRARDGQPSEQAYARAAREAEAAALIAAAERGRDTPQPMKSAPPLFRLNGCGAGLYGARDQWPDGSHIATYCICLLWIPIIPLSAYRVLDHGGGSFSFYGKQRLSGFARAFRALVLVGAALFVAGAGVTSYLDSPARKAGIALEEAEAIEASGDVDAAIVAYENLVDRYAFEDAAMTAANSIVRLEIARAPRPFGAQHIPFAKKLTSLVSQLPPRLRDGAPGDAVIASVKEWATPLPPHDALRLLDLASAISPTARREVADERRRLQVLIADERAKDWPVAALELYRQAGDAEKVAAMTKRIAEHPALLTANRALFENDPTVKEALDAALAAEKDPARTKLLESPTKKTLERYLAKHPKDQVVVVALASIERDSGKVDEPIRRLDALGTPGWMIPAAQQMLASLHLSAGRPEKAEAILDPYLETRLPSFAAARARYLEALTQSRERYISQAQNGRLPSDIDLRLSKTAEADVPKVFFEWVTEQQAKDPNLTRLRSIYEAMDDVVPASITLGMVKLRRANEESGTARERLLADAERMFLTIRAEAEGLPTYHLGLGQVYHRLGKAAEGDKELQGLMQRGDPYLMLAVARTYRELGIIKDARAAATKAYEAGNGEIRSSAATTLALLAVTLEEEESWLKKADTKSPYVQNRLREVKAHRALRRGAFDEADRLFAQVASVYEKEAAHNSASANNAALANQMRFECTGDIRMLKRSIAGLERALKLEPDSSLVLGNLAAAHEYAGHVAIVAKHLDTSLVPLDDGDAKDILTVLLRGSRRQDVETALRESPAIRRAIELSRQEEILAPERINAYARASSYASSLRDTVLLEALVKRLEHVERVDLTVVLESMASYKRGEQDDKILETSKSTLARLEAALKRAKAARDKRSIGAIHLLLGEVLSGMAPITSSTEDTLRGVAEFEKASAAWPALDTRKDQIDMLTRVAFLKAKAESKTFEKAWNEDFREIGGSMMLFRAMSGPDAKEIGEVLRRQPELGRAVTLAKSLDDDQLRRSQWVLARVAEDRELEQRAVAVFRTELDRLEMKVGEALGKGTRSHEVSKEMTAAALSP